MRTICIIAATGALALAQEQQVFEHAVPPPPEHIMVTHEAGNVVVNKDVIFTADKATMGFVSAEISVDGKPVKGAPYSADTVNETVQVLADGNRITHKNTGVIYRDSEGRTRREQTIEAIGPWSTSSEPMKSIIINDNVAGATYFLDSKSKEARKLPMLQALPHGPEHAVGGTTRFAMSAGEPGIRTMVYKESSEAKSESLGKQTIQGVVCEGTRLTATIPEGTMGNERPIQILTERWYSPELQLVVLSKHSDPRMGETTYRLENLNRNEPGRSLFEVPADYTVSTETAKPRTFRFEKKPAQ